MTRRYEVNTEFGTCEIQPYSLTNCVISFEEWKVNRVKYRGSCTFTRIPSGEITLVWNTMIMSRVGSLLIDNNVTDNARSAIRKMMTKTVEVFWNAHPGLFRQAEKLRLQEIAEGAKREVREKEDELEDAKKAAYAAERAYKEFKA